MTCCWIPGFGSSDEELTWLGERVEELGRVVHQICTEKIAELEKAVGPTT